MFEELVYAERDEEPPSYDPNKHNHDDCGDVGLVLTQYAPGEPRPSNLPRGLDALRLRVPDAQPVPDMDPIEAWLGRPGMIFVDEILPGSPAHECGLIQVRRARTAAPPAPTAADRPPRRGRWGTGWWDCGCPAARTRTWRGGRTATLWRRWWATPASPSSSACSAPGRGRRGGGCGSGSGGGRT